MAPDQFLPRFLELLKDLSAWLQSEGLHAAVVGGVAVSLRGRARATADLDVLVALESGRWEAFLDSGGRFGFEPRQDGALEAARQNYQLRLRHAPSGVPVDVLFGQMPFEREVIDRAETVEVGGVRVPLARAEGLIILKAVAGRPQDVLDICSLLDAHPEIDIGEVRVSLEEICRTAGTEKFLQTLDRALQDRESS